MADNQEQDWRPFLRVLLYPVMFDKDLDDNIAKGLRAIDDPYWSDLGDSFLTAIESALRSNEDLTCVLPNPRANSDEVVRRYLSKIGEELVRRKLRQSGLGQRSGPPKT